MNPIVKTTLLASSLAAFAFAPIATADDDFGNGLPILKARIKAKLTAINDAIDENTAAIGANAAAIDANSAAIGANSSAIDANSTAIGNNGAAITTNSEAITALQAGEPTYDYRDYAAANNIASKTYNIRNISTCDTEVRHLDRVTTGDNTEITMTRVRTEAGAACRYHVFKFLATPEGRYRLGVDNYNRAGTRINSSVTMDKPALQRTSSMEIGKAEADATTTTVVDNVVAQTFPGTYVGKNVLAGIESVTVPYNGGTTFEDCMKLHIIHQASHSFGTGLIDRVQWNCPGIGMVKRMHGNGVYYELTDIGYAP